MTTIVFAADREIDGYLEISVVRGCSFSDRQTSSPLVPSTDQCQSERDRDQRARVAREAVLDRTNVQMEVFDTLSSFRRE